MRSTPARSDVTRPGAAMRILATAMLAGACAPSGMNTASHPVAAETPAVSAQAGANARATEPFLKGVFCYPDTYMESGQRWPGLVARDVDHVTTRIPLHPIVDGAVWILYWSVLEPEPGQYRWDLVDRVLAYWYERGKRVVLNIATEAIPVSFAEEFGGDIRDACPGWLSALGAAWLSQVECNVMGLDQPAPRGRHIPLPWDPVYRERYSRLIAEMGRRYDGHPALEFVRIGTGHIGEETFPFYVTRNYPENVLEQARAAGWTPERWYDSVLEICDFHRAAFRKTPLSINLIMAGYLYKDPEHFMQADRLLHYCLAHGIMMGNNGLRNVTIEDIENVESSPRATYWLLAQFSALGARVENEFFGPPGNPQMNDPRRIYRALLRTRPAYLNMFGPTVGFVNHFLDPAAPSSSYDRTAAGVSARGEDPAHLASEYVWLFDRIMELKQ
jgi:hypothetical protein